MPGVPSRLVYSLFCWRKGTFAQFNISSCLEIWGAVKMKLTVFQEPCGDMKARTRKGKMKGQGGRQDRKWSGLVPLPTIFFFLWRASDADILCKYIPLAEDINYYFRQYPMMITKIHTKFPLVSLLIWEKVGTFRK